MPRNKYPEETVKKILQTSLKLFVEKGYEQTTVLDIVANLGGLTRGAFYHHFKSKEEVLDAIFLENFGDGSQFEPFVIAARNKKLNGLQRVKLALKNALMDNIGDETRTNVASLIVSMISNPRFLAEKVKGDQKTAALLAPMIEEGMKDGSIQQGNPLLLAELFMLLANFWMMPSIFPCEPEVMREKGEMLYKIFQDLGCPIIDEEMGDIFEQVLEEILT